MIDGGPAFPGIETRINGLHEQYRAYYGMTLRDYFAGLAMQGAISNNDLLRRISSDEDDGERAARFCYLLADAMLKARELSDE
jgi:hypothetical protein